MMQARDAAGRQVSLLNDDGYEKASLYPPQHRPLTFQPSTQQAIPRPYPSPRTSSSSSPNTPELLRSDSYDSQMSSNDPISPLTPSVDYAYARGALYPVDAPPAKRPAYVNSSRSASFDDDSSSHGCEKTFTTSGHASRHSKIHTAEKAVQCTYPGCQKKFTRADNMKQHLETHYKDKSRSSGGARAHKAALAEARRNSTASSRSRSSTSTTTASSAGGREAGQQWEGAETHHPQYPLPSPGTAAWDMGGMKLPLLSRPVAARTPSSGLDALAMAVECQAGSS
ncbi:hypothetical protein ACCO45_003211 [Purpureocillium lilacinum]|uniref:Uncharacterized protein n=1 Tax=Purpureocillium lilacinum TaxID=33203 RepID=A0ACC4E2E0_PURLI